MAGLAIASNITGDSPPGLSHEAGNNVPCTQAGPGERSGTEIFQLLNLPAELRNMVYGFAFEEQAITIQSTGQKARSKAPSLLLTSRQLYQEALPIYYEHTPVETGSLSNFIIWVQTQRPKYLHLIPELKLVLVLASRKKHSQAGSYAENVRGRIKRFLEQRSEVRRMRIAVEIREHSARAAHFSFPEEIADPGLRWQVLPDGLVARDANDGPRFLYHP